MSEKTFSIGEAAELSETTTRTLRYYEELGLIASTRPSATGQRRYSAEDIERIRHIRDLQTLLGLELDEIGGHLAATDRLDGLRAEYYSEPPAERREAILDEVDTILRALREKVLERQGRLGEFLSDLDRRISRVESLRAGAPPDAPPG